MDNHKKWIPAALNSDYSLHIKNISKKNLPYFISWIAIFIWLYSYFLPMGGFKFESQLYYNNVGRSQIYLYIWLFTGCLTPVLWDGRRFVPKTFYSVLGGLACFTLIRFTGASPLSKGLMLIASACMGHIFASITYSFFMVLNNSEKFYSMILAVLLPKILMLIKPAVDKDDTDIVPSIIILLIILILAVCSYLFRNNTDAMPVSATIKAPAKAYFLMPLVFVTLAINDVIAPACLNQVNGLSKEQIGSYYFLGVLLGSVVIIFLQKRFLIEIYNMLNLSFALLVIGFTAVIISIVHGGVGFIAAVCFGSSYAVGFVNIYYLAGFMAKKFQSVFFYKVGIFLATLYYLASFLVLAFLEKNRMPLTPVYLAFGSISVVVVFFVLYPFFIKMLFLGEWIDDAYRLDVTKCSRLEAKLKDYKLTPAEIEVCRLLLDGCTLRQIAGIQSKAYATINTYCTSIYRKLQINSRAELLLILQDYIAK